MQKQSIRNIRAASLLIIFIILLSCNNKSDGQSKTKVIDNVKKDNISKNINDSIIKTEYSNIEEALKYIDSVKSFYLTGVEIVEIPKEIQKFVNLEKLTIYYTTIQELPLWLFDIETLKELVIDNNPIKEIPSEIMKLKNLQELEISATLIKTLPDKLGNISNLQNLDLNSNSIEILPNSMADLKKLKYISIRFNKLKKIPEFIYELNNLEKINLGGNYIEKIPDDIKKLENVKVFHIDQNMLNPEEVKRMKDIFQDKYLHIYNQFNYEHLIPIRFEQYIE